MLRHFQNIFRVSVVLGLVSSCGGKSLAHIDRPDPRAAPGVDVPSTPKIPAIPMADITLRSGKLCAKAPTKDFNGSAILQFHSSDASEMVPVSDGVACFQVPTASNEPESNENNAEGAEESPNDLGEASYRPTTSGPIKAKLFFYAKGAAQAAAVSDIVITDNLIKPLTILR